jgi:hypothetical protein
VLAYEIAREDAGGKRVKWRAAEQECEELVRCDGFEPQQMQVPG